MKTSLSQVFHLHELAAKKNKCHPEENLF